MVDPQPFQSCRKLFLFPAVFVVAEGRRLDFDPFAGFAVFLRLGDGFADHFRHRSQGFFLIFPSAFGSGKFRISHDADFDFRALTGGRDLLRLAAQSGADLIGVLIVPHPFGQFGFVHFELVELDQIFAVGQHEGSFGVAGMEIIAVHPRILAGPEIAAAEDHDEDFFEGGIDPFLDAERFLELGETFRAAVSREDQDVFETLSGERIHDVAHHGAESDGADVDGAGELSAGETVIERGRDDAAEFFRQNVGRHFYIVRPWGLRCNVKSPAKKIAAHILLPEDKTPKTLLVNGEETAFALTTVGESRYVDADVTPTDCVADFEVLY